MDWGGGDQVVRCSGAALAAGRGLPLSEPLLAGSLLPRGHSAECAYGERGAAVHSEEPESRFVPVGSHHDGHRFDGVSVRQLEVDFDPFPDFESALAPNPDSTNRNVPTVAPAPFPEIVEQYRTVQVDSRVSPPVGRARVIAVPHYGFGRGHSRWRVHQPYHCAIVLRFCSETGAHPARGAHKVATSCVSCGAGPCRGQ